MSLTTGARRAVLWIKKNPLYGFIAIAAPVVGMLAGAPKAYDAVLDLWGMPQCLTYSNVYYYYNGHFKHGTDGWVEYQGSTKIQFSEFYRNRDYIVLVNRTPRVDPRAAGMLVRLPVCGGTAQ